MKIPLKSFLLLPLFIFFANFSCFSYEFSETDIKEFDEECLLLANGDQSIWFNCLRNKWLKTLSEHAINSTNKYFNNLTGANNLVYVSERHLKLFDYSHYFYSAFTNSIRSAISESGYSDLPPIVVPVQC